MLFKQRLNAALGYMNLDMTGEALAELDSLPPEELHLPEVYAVRTAILIRRRDWEGALDLARNLCRSHPDQPSPFLDLAFCLHELRRTEEAKQTLLAGPPILRQTGIFFYNLACYEAQLGNLGPARDYLNQAVRMDERYREMALGDPDLDPLKNPPQD
ncbi:MAG: tetratricopeptide repeat protein [Candidatus Methylacidiphilales bacterium]|nr:tetratricopeptide repeat protein [Candidatus Methylacidiphilales bacterium]